MSNKIYDLEERTYQFAKSVTLFCKNLPRNTPNIEHVRQLVRSFGSVGANYIEANESFSKKDFIMRIKICRKEAKESAYWIKLIGDTNPDEFEKEAASFKGEAEELKKFFSSIVAKSN